MSKELKLSPNEVSYAIVDDEYEHEAVITNDFSSEGEFKLWTMVEVFTSSDLRKFADAIDSLNSGETIPEKDKRWML